MAGMLYFWKDKKAVSIEEIEEVGLAYAIDKSPNCVEAVSARTPAKATGTTFANSGMPKMDLANQTWIQMTANKKLLDAGLWCGYDNKPGPEDLKRKNMVAGNTVTLSDNNDWQVPLVRDIEGSTNLPQFLAPSREGDGKWSIEGMADEHRRLWDGCGKFMEFSLQSMTEDGEVEFDWDDLLDVSADLICSNYRVGKDEVGILKLCSIANAIEVMKAAVDWSELERRITEAAKKNDQPEENTSSTPTGDNT